MAQRKSIKDYLDGEGMDDEDLYKGTNDGLDLPIQYQQRMISQAVAIPAVKAIETASKHAMYTQLADRFLDKGIPSFGGGTGTDQGDWSLALAGIGFLLPGRAGKSQVMQAVLKALR